MPSFVKTNVCVLVTQKMTKKGHNVREYVLSKEWLQKYNNSWILISKKRKEIDHWEPWLTNVFHVLSMKKIFQSTWFEMKQATCMFNLDQRRIKHVCQRAFGFISEFDDWICSQKSQFWQLCPLQGITRIAGKDDYDKTCMAGKVWENPCVTRMAGNFLRLIMYDRRKTWWLMCF